MNYIIEYAKNIIFFLLFFTFVKMFINDKSYGKYIEVILGFILIIILTQPIKSIFSMENIDFSIGEGENINVDKYVELGEGYSLSLSEETIKKQVEALLDDGSYEVVDTSISLDEEYNLKLINIILRRREIREIEIEGAVVEDLEILEIKNRLKDFYDLSSSHINVYIN